ncbi:CD225/dispanin family protein [Draconibacterium halophilum]|uniref:CD225/dispanin family protein n=1 Tax=Draconibacterium halophilum TaxID=2706887 RepID=A0A6C0R970_9BACT|nr:CD225/dispanin family protein [Draconibacterium halophilum]QIA06739.1 CD225/dispanin family protein [Draconibacterium halophilum]
MNEQVNQSQYPPSNYLVFAILATIFCGKIFGLVAIIFAAQVNSHWSAGNYDAALSASRNAKLWAWISVAAGIAWALIFTMLAVFGALAGLMQGAFDF